MKDRFHKKVVALLSSVSFFRASLLVFVVEASWIALSGRFSMAYDENTHLASIQLYAHRWLPFWSGQPPGADHLGAIWRDPSYMYHYLISFPFRVFTIFVGSETGQVLFLRFISIALFATGIILYRKLFRLIGVSRATTQATLAVFILLPLVPFLAAQINYDNALFPLSVLSFILAVQLIIGFKRAQTMDVYVVLQLVVVSLFSSLVMYSFLPIVVANGLLVLMMLVKSWRAQGRTKTWQQITKSFGQISLPLRLLLIGLIILLTGLFFERYGINTIRYGHPVPDCDKVMTLDACKAYSPWLRNYQSHQDNLKGLIKPVASDPISYTARDWLRIMTVQLFFALNGQVSSFKIGRPLPLPVAFTVILVVIGALLVIKYRDYLKRWPGLLFLALTGLLYTATLWYREYFAFLSTGYAVAVQTRYLVAFLPILCLILVLAYGRWLRHQPWLKSVLVTMVILLLLFEGGGATVFIVRSDANWYWPNHAVLKVNQAAQKLLKLFIIGA